MLETKIHIHWHREQLIRIAYPLECEGCIYHVKIDGSTYMDVKSSVAAALTFAQSRVDQHLDRKYRDAGVIILGADKRSDQSYNNGADDG